MIKTNSLGLRNLGLALLAILAFHTSASASSSELSGIQDAIKRKGAKWRAGNTSVSQLSAKEKLRRLGAILSPEVLSRSLLRSAGVVGATGTTVTTGTTSSTMAATLDWRNSNGVNAVTPVKNQGSCGSCWAFSVTAGLESQMLMQGLTVVPDQAEQILLSCSGAGSCGGGYPGSAAGFVQTTGLPPEPYFPYSGSNLSCSYAQSNWQSATAHIGGILSVAYSVDAIKQALAAYGPLPTTFAVYQDFYYYAGGVYSYTSGGLMGGHAVEIIGYDDVAKAFIVKNSWGAGWGESGFFRIAYSEVGGVTQFGSGTMAFQPSSACFYMLSSAGGGFSQTGGSSSFNVGTLKSCSWTASSNASWAALTGGSSGTGNGTVSYSVANNSGLARSATITAAGQSYNVSQAECAYSLSSTNATFTRKGGKGSFNVVNSGGCSWPWTASNNGISWITITSGFSGTGNGTVSFSVPSHTGKLTRSGAITVADQVFNITQN